MDEKSFLKKALPKILQDSDEDEQKQIFKKMNAQALVKFNKLKEEYLKNSSENLYENFKKKVDEYNRKKEAEYRNLMKTIQEKEKNYYDYFKKYEKKHGWQKATELLESFGSMKRWINFNFAIEKLDRFDKMIKKKKEPDIEMPQEQEMELKYPKLENIELPTPEEVMRDQILSEQKMNENLNNDLPAQQLKQLLESLQFSPEQIESILKQLTPGEMATILQRFQFEVGGDVTSPGHGKSPTTTNQHEDAPDDILFSKKPVMLDLLWEYGVMY